MSSTAAEMYVEADEAGRRRGFTKSVLAALIEYLLSQSKIVLFRVADDDYDAFEDSFDLGFKPTGVRTLMAEVRKNESNDE
jgi:L-amino acid N-acyltransferase YncA